MKIVAVVNELDYIDDGAVTSETRVYAVDSEGALFQTVPGAPKWLRVKLPPFPAELTPKDAE